MDAIYNYKIIWAPFVVVLYCAIVCVCDCKRIGSKELYAKKTRRLFYIMR